MAMELLDQTENPARGDVRVLRVLALAAVFLFLPPVDGQSGEAPAGGLQTHVAETLSGWERDRIVLATTGVGVAAVSVWGAVFWDYFTQTPTAGTEGWFGSDTKEGGMDKLGHLYATYAVSHAVSWLYEHWNFEKGDAALYGSLTALAVLGYMEIGDSFSSYGFSYEDMVMNAAGALLGYLHYTRPGLAEKIDLRWQIGFHPNKADVMTDYENSKFLLALKLNGFGPLRKSPLRHVELHLGYYAEKTAGATTYDRHPYLGVGINLTDLLRRNGWSIPATFFNYIQLPYTSINHDFTL